MPLVFFLCLVALMVNSYALYLHFRHHKQHLTWHRLIRMLLQYSHSKHQNIFTLSSKSVLWRFIISHAHCLVAFCVTRTDNLLDYFILSVLLQLGDLQSLYVHWGVIADKQWLYLTQMNILRIKNAPFTNLLQHQIASQNSYPFLRQRFRIHDRIVGVFCWCDLSVSNVSQCSFYSHTSIFSGLIA